MNFEFATATRIIFGAGKLAEAGALVRALGTRPLVVRGQSAAARQRAEPLLNQLPAASSFAVAGEPTVDVVRAGTDQARRDRKSTRLNSSHSQQSRMPSSA